MSEPDPRTLVPLIHRALTPPLSRQLGHRPEGWGGLAVRACADALLRGIGDQAAA